MMRSMQLSWRGVNWLLLGTSTVMFATEGHLIAFTPLQLRLLGLDDVEVGVWTGILVAVTMATALPLGPFWGVLAERFSRRAILLRTFVVLAISLLVAAWAENLTWLVVARGIIGFSYGVGGVITATQAMVTPTRQIGRAVATVQTAMPIAASIGPPLAALAIPTIGLHGLYVIDAVLALVAGAVVAVLVAHLARVGPRNHQTGVFGFFPTVGNVGGLIFPLLAASVVGSGLWAAFAIGALGYAASVVSGIKLGRTPDQKEDVSRPAAT
jgi:MFS family permease